MFKLNFDNEAWEFGVEYISGTLVTREITVSAVGPLDPGGDNVEIDLAIVSEMLEADDGEMFIVLKFCNTNGKPNGKVVSLYYAETTLTVL